LNPRMTRRDCLTGILGSAAALAGCVSGTRAGEDKPARPRNVLLIAVDDLNLHLGCYGHPLVKSPSIDRLAKRGVRFEHAYCQFPVCNPSRSSLLTSLRPETTGVLDNRVPLLTRKPDAMTMPRWFREHGYVTASVGKIFHGTAKFSDPRAWDVELRPKGTPAGRGGEGRNLTGGVVTWCSWRAAEGTDDDQADGLVAKEAARLLGEKREGPLFLAVGFHKPHDPFIAPKKYFDLYPLDRLVLPTVPDDATAHLRHSIGSGWKQDFDKFTDRERREFMRAYYAGASFMDAQLGRVLDALDRSGLADDTVVLFFSDHGYQLGTHGWWNKNTLYDESCRAPLIVATPGMPKAVQGRACSAFVEFIDFFPTLVELCGLPAPPGIQGRSFAPLLWRPQGTHRDSAYTVVKRGEILGRSVRTERWRYTEWDFGRQGAELYDHRADPGEYRNLAESAENADTVKRLGELLHQYANPSPET